MTDLLPENILNFIQRPMQNNSFLVIDLQTKECALIDPSFECESILTCCQQQNLSIRQIWLTHAHFDHIAGIKTICDHSEKPIRIFLHPSDKTLYESGGDGTQFGIRLVDLPQPTDWIHDKQVISIGSSRYTILHTPGHTPGHVTFYCADASLAFCGDLIFYRNVGRTDFPGGNPLELSDSIQKRIFTLPPETILLSGHGPSTNVADEITYNPFFQSRPPA